MNPLNSHQQQSTQYFITGMPPLAPATSTSMIKSNSSSNFAVAANSTPPTTFCSMNLSTSSAAGTNLVDTKYLTTTNYVPVLVTNQTVINSVDPLHQQQFQHPHQHHPHQQQQKITPNIISVSSSAPVVTGAPTSQMPLIQSISKPIVMTAANSANITYQMLTTPQTNNLSSVIPTPNGAVSVLLTTPQTMATAGHVAAPLIIRNTATTASVATSSTASAGAQIMQHLPTPPRQQQQQHHQQQHMYQQQSQIHHQQQQQLHKLNSQHINPELLKQIIVGNPGGGGSLAPGTTLLKTSLLPNKPVIQHQQQQQQKQLQPNQQQKQLQQQPQLQQQQKQLQTNQQQQQQQQKQLQTNQQQRQQQQIQLQQQQQQQKQIVPVVKNKMIISSQPLQPPQHHHLANQAKNVITDNSPKMFAALGMELTTANKVGHTNTNLVTHTVQKLSQVSLLQNSKKSLNNPKTDIINEPPGKVLKNASEIKVGNLNSEVSLIKKPNLQSEKYKVPSSLLKTSNKPQEEKQETSFLKDTKSGKIDQTQQGIKSSKINEANLNANSYSKEYIKTLATTQVAKEQTESSSLLKSKKDLNKNVTKVVKPVIDFEEKQESLLKTINTNLNETDLVQQPQLLSPRSQRSKSCNTSIKTKAASTNMANSPQERRHSEPVRIEQVKILKKINFKKSNKEDKHEIDSLHSEELDTLLEEFEDEEYLESSGDKSETTSTKDAVSEIIEKSNGLETKTKQKKAKEIIEKQENKEQKTLENMENSENFIQENKLAQETQKEETKVQQNEIDNEKQSLQETESSSDDDVTILPMEEDDVEPIEIDDEDEEEEHEILENKQSPSAKENDKLNESLLCDEQVLVSSSSSLSNHSSEQISANLSTIKSPKLDTTSTSTPLLKKTLMDHKSVMAPREQPVAASSSNGHSSVLEMLSNFNMLNWRERVGSARGTILKFQLNEFNLLQVFENVPSHERRIHTAYEKPIYERESSFRAGANKTPIFYMCRRCNVQGPAVDFLAPEFCSLSCLKRDCRKRQRDDNACILRKRPRYAPQPPAININQPPPLTYILPHKFRWSSYLKSNLSSIAAPISLFLNPFPTGPNNFIVGMKLEAIDPENCSLFCVCTVIEIMGYRLKLSFDGYDSSYDFWLNADSMDIFPPGWCSKTNRILQPPQGINANKFNWGTYLNKEKAMPAPRHLFTHLNSASLTPRNPFKVGMYLEAEDLNDTGKLCVASIADVLDDRIRIHFDGWDDCYDIIVDINSPYIHPCGWHEGRQQLVVPPDCENTVFNWDDYIRKQATGGEAASEEIFSPRDPIHFKPNMKLEVVDPRNPSLIRPATVVTHKGHRVKLHLDCWPNDYCFWLEDDSPDLHPIGWCDATCHDLEPPPGFQMAKQKMPCPVTGCRGIGNAKKPFMSVHASRDCCPYAAENWRIVMERPPRLNFDNITRSLPKHNRVSSQTQQQQSRLSDQQILERLQMLDNIKTRNVLVQQEKPPTKYNTNDIFGATVSNIKREEIKDIKPSRLSTSNSNSSSCSSTTAATSNKNSEDDNILDVNLDIAKEFLCDYGPRLQQTYSLWQKNFTFDADKIKRNPMKWSTTEVSVFVDLYLNCRKTATVFNQEDIDGQALLLLQQEDLTDKLGLKLGPAVKLYMCILQLRTLAVTKFYVPYKQKSERK